MHKRMFRSKVELCENYFSETLFTNYQLKLIIPYATYNLCLINILQLFPSFEEENEINKPY